jgi:hypothetical protein
MAVVHQPQEQHFSDGEPDLEPPEELCLEELDEDTLLEDDLDGDLVAEDDVEESRIQETLEAMTHAEDEVGGEDPDLASDEFRCQRCLQLRHRVDLVDPRGPLCRSCAA